MRRVVLLLLLASACLNTRGITYETPPKCPKKKQAAAPQDPLAPPAKRPVECVP